MSYKLYELGGRSLNTRNNDYRWPISNEILEGGTILTFCKEYL